MNEVKMGLSNQRSMGASADLDDAFATRMGVHYPTGFAVIALTDERTQSQFLQALTASGFERPSFVSISTEQFRDYLRQTLNDAGMLAQIVASELKQSQIFLQLAEQGARFLFVRVADDKARDTLIDVGLPLGSLKAVYYQSLAIEELPFSRDVFPGPSPYGANETPRNKSSNASQ